MATTKPCPHCGADIESDSWYCDQCGKQLVKCPQCGNFLKGNFCATCGKGGVYASTGQPVQAGAGAPGAAPVSNPAPSDPAAGRIPGIDGSSFVGAPGGPAPSASPRFVGAPVSNPAAGAPAFGGPISNPAAGAPVYGGPVSNPAAGAPVYGGPVSNPAAGAPAFCGPISNPAAGAPVYGGPVSNPAAGAPAYGGPISNPAAGAPAGGTSFAGGAGAAAGMPQRLSCRAMGIVLPLQNGAIIGRKTGNYIAQLSTLNFISGQHARLDFNGSSWTITDLGSTNGTTVNGMPCYPHQPMPFKTGDLVKVGKTYDFYAE